MPPSNAYLSKEDLEKPEPKYPLKLLVCTNCWLVQTEDFVGRDKLFTSDYAYFSSTSKSWLEHAANFCDNIIPVLGLGPKSLVVEIASNDGYLLKNFLNSGIPCLGIEPTNRTAEAAETLGIPVMREFFDEKLGRSLAVEGKQADLIIGNNVFAHVPDINDFTLGLKAALKPGGTITLEFPHLMRLIEQVQFDTVYHEHFSYLSLSTAQRIFNAAGLRVWDVKQLTTHGGSLRIYGCHHADSRATSPAVAALLAEEAQRGLQNLTSYQQFQARADKVEDDLLSFLRGQKRAGKKVAAYGAAAKGNTLLNYGQIQPNLLPVVCDAAPSKQGKFLPGSRIPVHPPEFLKKFDPDVVLVLPWNLAREIRQVCAAWVRPGTKFIKAVPALTPA